MSAILDLSALTFSADQLRELNELVVKEVLKAPMLTNFHTMATGIKNDREIGISPGTLGLIGKAAQGCGTLTAETPSMTGELKTWEPKRIQVLLRQCYTDLSSTMLKLARNLGVEVSDLTTTEYFAFLLDMLAVDIPKMILRHAWFGNTSAATVDDSPAGVLTSGIDADYFNIINGFFYQLGVIYAADSTRKTTIAANSEATQALQFSAFTASLALAALNSVVDDAPATLAAQPDKILIVTNSVFKKAYRALQAAGLAYDIKLQSDGFNFMSWDGIPMYSMPLFDEWILAYENDGIALNSPHRIVYTTKKNLNIGMEGDGLFENIDTWYDKTTKYNYIEAMDAFDAKIYDDTLVQVGI